MSEPFTHDYYRRCLLTALESGYDFISFDQAASFASSDENACILRHDCDNDLAKAAAMARLENALGIRSTFFIMLRSTMYNALSYSSAKHVLEIVSLGHSIALHFDEELVRELSADATRAEIDFECSILERYFGKKITTVSFHRPGPRVLSGELRIAQINTYDKNDLGSYQYVSDSSNIMRIDLERAFKTRHFKKLHLNLHPEWWAPQAGNTDNRWMAMLEDSLLEREAELWTREEAYLRRVRANFQLTDESRGLPNRLLHQRYEVDGSDTNG